MLIYRYSSLASLLSANLISFISLFLFVISCATPTVVNVVGPNDSKMSCSQLDVEIAMANKYAEDD